jgi:hypothetical protein
MARGKRSGTTREQQSSGLFPWRAGEEEQEGLRPWRKESPAALLSLPIGEENKRVSHGRVAENGERVCCSIFGRAGEGLVKYSVILNSIFGESD